MRRLVHSLFLLLITVSTLNAQDIHLSHIHASPVLLNPGMTGLYNGDLRVIANARSQWNSITKGYKTAIAGVDARIFEIGRNDIIAGGLQVYSDKAGDLDFTTRSVNGTVSVLKAIGRDGNTFLSFGLSGALVTNSVDYSKIVAFDPEPSIQNGASPTNSYLDVAGGLAYFYTFDRDNSFHVGAAAFHLNNADVSLFKDNTTDEGISLHRKLVLHGGGDFRLKGRMFMKPSFLFMDQGPHRQITLGTFLKYRTLKYDSNGKRTSLYAGAWLRWYTDQQATGTDAIVAAVRFDHKSTFITFSFDINISTLSRVSQGRGGPELSIVKIFDINRTSKKSVKLRCPDF